MSSLSKYVLAALILFVSSSASARSYITPMVYNEGPGLLVGDSLVIHPGALLEGRFDSNPTLSELNVNSAPYMRIIAHLDMATRSRQRLRDVKGTVVPQKFQFRLKSAFSYREYFSPEVAITNQSGFEVDFGLGLKYQPGRIFGFEFNNDFERSVTPRDLADNPTGDIPDPTLIRDMNNAGIRMNFAPGGGRLTFALGYNFRIDFYENDPLNNLNNYLNQVSLETKWRLFPRTAVVLEIVQGFVNYYETTGIGGNATQPPNVDSMPLRVLAGLTGLVTSRLTATARIGYGGGFYDGFGSIMPGGTTTESFSGVLGRVDLSYMLLPTAVIRVGYDHEFEDSTYSNYYIDEHGFIDYNHHIANRFILRGTFDYRFRQYEGFDAINAFSGGSMTELSSHLFTGRIGVDYRIKSWTYVGISYELHARLMAAGAGTAPPGTAGTHDFIRHQFIGKVGVAY